jgi:predicted RNase H-like nuclease (RuvC/YqgF family)
MKRDGRDDRIDELERENVKLRAENRALRALVESQAPTIAALERRIQEFSAAAGSQDTTSISVRWCRERT